MASYINPINLKFDGFIHGIIYSNLIKLQFDLLPTELAGRRKLSKSQNRSAIAITYYIPLIFVQLLDMCAHPSNRACRTHNSYEICQYNFPILRVQS